MTQRLWVTFLFFWNIVRDLAGTLLARIRRRYDRAVLGVESLAVGVDIFPFFERMTGVGWYEWNVLSHLPAVDPQMDIRLYAHTFGAPEESPPPPLPTALRTRFRFHHMPRGFLLPVRPTLAILRLLVEPLFLFLDGNDVFFAPNFFVPRRHMAAVRSLVPTVHDLTFLRLPNTVQRETLDNLRRHLPRVLFAADALIAVSAATARDLAAFGGVTPRRVHVIHEGVDPGFLSRGSVSVGGLPPRYLLFVSTLEPRKNVVMLLDAFARAVDQGYPGELVLVGRWGWRTEAAQEALRRSPVRRRVRHLDYLDRETLSAVMHGAEALVFPSLLEGFGLPVVEAMACGVPVIVSRASSLPEVAGEAALYVDPHDASDIAVAIGRLTGDPGLRECLSARGRARAARFRWEETARATAAVLRRAGGLAERYADTYCV
jgi:glycosyltransferase involved in cell wall biosynthesis